MSDKHSTPAEFRDIRDVKIVLAAALAVFFLSTCMTSRLYWGYWLTPPSSDRTASYLDEVSSFTSFWQSGSTSGAPALSLAARNVNNVSGEAPAGRLPAALVNRGLLPASAQPVDASMLHLLTEALTERGLLRHGEPGYSNATELQGHIAIGKDKTGKELIAAALVGGEVSIDHRPYYELVAERVGEDQVKIQRSSFYWWDLAGGEGFAHWLGGAAATVAWLVGAFIFLAVRRRVRDHRERVEQFGSLLR